MHKRFVCNSLLLGILNFNGVTGRSGEWDGLKVSHVCKTLKKGSEHLVCCDRKTVETVLLKSGFWQALVPRLRN